MRIAYREAPERDEVRTIRGGGVFCRERGAICTSRAPPIVCDGSGPIGDTGLASDTEFPSP